MPMILATLIAAADPLVEAVPGLSSPMNDYNLSADARERLLVFARSKAEFRNARIMVIERTRRGWGAPAPISFSDERYADSDPWLTPDGRTLYFISDRPAAGREAGRQDYDIWRSTRTGKGWSLPEHLGPQVNGRGQELGPELHGGSLYFSSARRSGLGGLDIYQAPVDGRSFGQAVLIEGPFNTAASESDLTLSPDGQAAMFWRSAGNGGIIHIAYRQGSGWTTPAALPSNINAGAFNFTPSFTRSGWRIRYASTVERPGQEIGLADIYETSLPKR